MAKITNFLGFFQVFLSAGFAFGFCFSMGVPPVIRFNAVPSPDSSIPAYGPTAKLRKRHGKNCVYLLVIKCLSARMGEESRDKVDIFARLDSLG